MIYVIARTLQGWEKHCVAGVSHAAGKELPVGAGVSHVTRREKHCVVGVPHAAGKELLMGAGVSHIAGREKHCVAQGQRT
jgi:hypothetical protein